MAADRPPASGEPHRDYAGRTCTTGLMHSHPVSGEPSTEAGRDLLAMLETHDADDLNMLARIRAIEAEARATRAEPPGLSDDAPILRLLGVVMSLRRMVEDGHPNDKRWFSIMSERLSSVMDLTDEALMEGTEVVAARLAAPTEDET